MRVTAANQFQSAITNLQKRQQDLAESQVKLTSGKRVLTPSDDPVAAARAERALAAMLRAESEQRALDASRNAVRLTEGALGDAGELLQQARELVVAAGNGSYTDRDRATLAQNLRAIRDQLLAAANRGDGAGGYLFGAQGSDSPPFVDAPGGVQFIGVAGEAAAATSEPLPLSFDGRQAWLGVPNPVAGNPDLSAFAVLDGIATLLETPGQTGAVIDQGVRDGLRDIDAVNNHLLALRARAGETLNRADAIEARLTQAALDAQLERSNAEDLDMVQAISDFQNQQTGYDAALKSYALVQRMSLFNFLSA